MKKLTIILTTAVLFFTVVSFTIKTDEIPGKVKTAFQKRFANALNVSWEKGDNIYLAHFNWEAMDVRAAFDSDGSLLSITRTISSTQLPLKVTMAIQENFAAYQLSDSSKEIIVDNEAKYRFVLSNSKQTVLLTSTSDGDISEEK